MIRSGQQGAGIHGAFDKPADLDWLALVSFDCPGNVLYFSHDRPVVQDTTLVARRGADGYKVWAPCAAPMSIPYENTPTSRG